MKRLPWADASRWSGGKSGCLRVGRYRLTGIGSFENKVHLQEKLELYESSRMSPSAG